MKIRYPGPSVSPERRSQPEYVSAFGLPLPVGEAIEVPDAHGEALVVTGLVELVEDEPAAAPLPAPASSPAATAEETEETATEPAADAEPAARKRR